MVDQQRIPLGTLFSRALRRACPRCGGKPIFSGWWRILPKCPRCGYHFEREDGYWVSAMIVNIGVTEALFGVLFITTLLLSIPDVQWGPLLLIAATTNVIFPILFYPYSKTLWMTIDMHFHPVQSGEGQTPETTKRP